MHGEMQTKSLVLATLEHTHTHTHVRFTASILRTNVAGAAAASAAGKAPCLPTTTDISNCLTCSTTGEEGGPSVEQRRRRGDGRETKQVERK